MKINEIINNSQYNVKLLSEIKNSCQDFLKQANNLPLYRGLPNITEITFIRHPKDREALNSRAKDILFFDSIIYEAFGISNVRQTSFFTSSGARQASFYGDLCYCFPVGNIKYIWSDTIRDSYSNRKDIFKSVAEYLHADYNNVIKLFILLADTFQASSKWLEPKFINESRKIFLDIVNVSCLEEVKDITFDNLIDALKTCGLHLYHNTDLSTALANNNGEILITQSDGYYLIPTRHKWDSNNSENNVNDLKNKYKEILGEL